MLQNAYFLAKIGADTAENEQHFAEILPTDALNPSAAELAESAGILDGIRRVVAPEGRRRRLRGWLDESLSLIHI